MLTQSTGYLRVTVVRLNTNADLLQGIRQAVEDSMIRHGIILGAIGSVSCYSVHVVSSVDCPPSNAFLTGEGPYDIQTISGAIINGRVHAHATFSGIDRVVGGHLEEGCRVLTFGLVLLAETPDVDLTDWDRVGVLMTRESVVTHEHLHERSDALRGEVDGDGSSEAASAILSREANTREEGG